MIETSKKLHFAKKILEHIKCYDCQIDEAVAISKIVGIFEEHYFWEYYPHREIENLIFNTYEIVDSNQKLSRKLDELNKNLSKSHEGSPILCALNKGRNEDRPIELIVGGGSSIHEYESGRKKSDTTLKKWLENSTKIHIIDPYIFKRSQNKNETKDEAELLDKKYAEELFEVIGKNKEVDFIYKSKTSGDAKISATIANAVESAVPQNNLKARFWVASDLHDRIWIRENRKGDLSAKVIGTSRDGIGKRPTYILDMPSEDLKVYLKYVKHLKEISQKNNIRPTHFKAERNV